MTPKFLLTLAGSVALGVLTASTGRAATIQYLISLNTSSLVGNAAGPFSLNFQLNDGSGSGDGNNTATLTGFNFGAGGSATGSPVLSGGASGSLATTVTLTDSAFLNSFTQRFNPGASLSFLASLSNNVDAGPQPDQFSFAIFDSAGFELPTLNPAFDAFVTIDLSSANPTVRAFASDPSRLPVAGGTAITTGAVTAQVVPEPGTLALLGGGLLLVAAAARRRMS